MHRLLSALFLCIPLAIGCGAKPVAPPDRKAPAARALSQGNLSFQKGCYPNAIKSYQKAHEAYIAADDPHGIAVSLNNTGNAYRLMKRAEEAILYYREALATLPKTVAPELRILILANLGDARMDTGNLDAAENHLMAARQVDTTSGTALIPLLKAESRLAETRGFLPTAAAILETAYSLTSDARPGQQAGVRYAQGMLWLKTENLMAAKTAFSEALAIDTANGWLAKTASDLMALARTEAALKNPHAAFTLAARGIQLFALIGSDADVSAHLSFYRQSARAIEADTRLQEQWIENWLSGNAIAGPCG